MEQKALTEALKSAYVLMQENSGFKVGDRVKVLRKAATLELGWDNSWVPAMNQAVGKEFMVTRLKSGGVGIVLDNNTKNSFPFFVLELMKPAKPQWEPKIIRLNSDHVAKVCEHNVQVGCRVFEFSAIKTLALAVDAAQEYAKS